jgi:hypothetical protein
MKAVLAIFGACAAVGCGGESGVDATVFIDPPSNETGCVGVAGFEVIVSPVGRTAKTEQLVGSATILDARDCRMPRTFKIEELDGDSPVDIIINGYDGTGAGPRVTASKRLDNLRQSPVHVPLTETSSRPPLLVFQRNLEGASASDLDDITISRQMGSQTLLTITRMKAGVYMIPEPAAYGVNGLRPNGEEENTVLNVSYTAPMRTIKEQRITLHWTGVYYQPKP